MNTKHLRLLLFVLASAVFLWGVAITARGGELMCRQTLNHKEMVWLHALEWCESNGNKDAVNPNDLDNTPSYYSFQFKPGTFKHFAIKYKLLPKGLEDADYFNWMSDYEVAKKIVSLMILDRGVNLHNEFPHCLRKLGSPRM